MNRLALAATVSVWGIAQSALAQTATQNFASEDAAAAAGWTGFGNRINNFDFGFSPTNNADGVSGAGEGGGQIARSLPSGYYADTTLFGQGDLSMDLRATGRLKFQDIDFDGEVFFGWFDRELAEMDMPDNLDFVGFTFREPNNGLWRVFASIDDEFATNDHGPLGNQLDVMNDTAYDFEIDWDADGGIAAGDGKLTFTMTEVGGPGMFVSEAEGFDALTFDAFGMMTNNQTGNAGQIASFWFDDLEYSIVGTPFDPGDVNNDGVVNLDDLTVIRSNFLETVASAAEGDLNSDGIVDYADYREWKVNRTAGVAATVGTPEPDGLALATLAVAVCLTLSFRRRRTR